MYTTPTLPSRIPQIGLAGLLCIAASLGAQAGDLRVTTATYLGGPEEGELWSAVDIAPDGKVVVAGASAGFAPKDVKPVELLGGGYGVVLRISADGTQAVSLTRIGDYIEDMEIGDDGRIAITGSFGVTVLSPDAKELLWRDGQIMRGTQAAQFRNQTPPFKHPRYTRRVARVAIGADGTVASIQSEEKVHGEGPKQGHLYIWDKTGKRLCDVLLEGYKYLKDVCISAKHGSVIVGGFNTYAADSRHMKAHPIHMPFIAAFSYEGKRKWETYNFTAEATYAQNTFADSRVQRLVIGRDGWLYMGGYIHGGDFVWHHDPHDVTIRHKKDTGHDAYSKCYAGGGGTDKAYFAKYDPANGDLVQGQALVCRAGANGSGSGRQIQIRGLAADEQGNLYLSGYCQQYIKDRDSQTINGVAVGPYYKPEAFLMVVSPDFRKRPVWTVFSKKCESASWGLGVRNGRAAMMAEVFEGEMITTENAILSSPPSPRCGYLVTWKTGDDNGRPLKGK